jgi:hypothetical protein
MKEFIHKYEDRIHGVLSCFDRMLFRGYPSKFRRTFSAALVHTGERLSAAAQRWASAPKLPRQISALR